MIFLLKKILEYKREESGSTLDFVIKLEVNLANYVPFEPSSYIQLPKVLNDEKAILNIKNNENRCFMWSVLPHLHHVPYLFTPVE